MTGAAVQERLSTIELLAVKDLRPEPCVVCATLTPPTHLWAAELGQALGEATYGG